MHTNALQPPFCTLAHTSLTNLIAIVDISSRNQHNNGGKHENGEEITGDVQARSHGFVIENVVNLSNRLLTPDEIQILSRGLNAKKSS